MTDEQMAAAIARCLEPMAELLDILAKGDIAREYARAYDESHLALMSLLDRVIADHETQEELT